MLRVPLLDPINQLMSAHSTAPITASIFLTFSLRFFSFFKTIQMKMCCHLVRLKYQPLHCQPRLEERKGGGGVWRNLQWKADGGRESHNLSSSPIAQSEPCSPRRGRVGESLSGPHQRACTTLMHVKRSVNPPPLCHQPTSPLLRAPHTGTPLLG